MFASARGVSCHASEVMATRCKPNGRSSSSFRRGLNERSTGELPQGSARGPRSRIIAVCSATRRSDSLSPVHACHPRWLAPMCSS